MGTDLVTGPLDAGIELAFLRTRAQELARDIVCRIDKAEALAARYGLTPGQWEALRISTFFRQLTARMFTDLSGANGLQERIRIKALYAIDEAVVLDLTATATDPKAPYGARVDAAKLLQEFAGLGKGQAAAGATGGSQASSGPLISIRIGDNREVHIGGEAVTP